MALSQAIKNLAADIVRIAQHVVGVEADCLEPERREMVVAGEIALVRGGFEVLATVDFDDEIGGLAEKVCEVGAERCLPAHMIAERAQDPEPRPEQDFRLAHG